MSPAKTRSAGRPRAYAEIQKIVAVRLPPELIEQIDAVARDAAITRGQVIREAIERHLKRARR